MLRKKNTNFAELERLRQKSVINLIASENCVSREVLSALGSVFTNKYAEGYPGGRYYGGTSVADEMEKEAQTLALKVFKLSATKWSANVQPYSGSPANLAVYSALLEKGDKVLAMSLKSGGHLTHGSRASATGKLYDFAHYGVDEKGYIDFTSVRMLALEHKPKMIVCGATAYPHKIDYAKFGKIAKEVEAYLLADVSHIAGLISAGVHLSPFKYADVVMTTTHKTLRGPRGAIIFSKKELSAKIDWAVFPGLQGGPHLNQIYALTVALHEALSPSFVRYIKQVIKNADVLAGEMKKAGFAVNDGGTDNHLFLVDVSPLGINGNQASLMLQDAGIIVNKNMLFNDKGTAKEPSGIRIGTPAITTRGAGEKDMKVIAGFIKELLIEGENPKEVNKKVKKFLAKFSKQSNIGL